MSNIKPPKIVSRNEYGLIDELDYVFNEDGFIDWRKMIKQKFLVPNRDKTGESDVTKLKDSDLLILISGIKELAQIRGFTEVNYNLVSPSPDYVAAICQIKWIPNYETENKEVVFSGIGDANLSNTDNFARNFLAAIAENRAFVRCVRNFLKINIVGKEEMGPNDKNIRQAAVASDNFADPRNFLQILMNEKKISFEELKKKLTKEGVEGANEFVSIVDVPIIKVLELIERIKKIK
jgi:hypothetical protein